MERIHIDFSEPKSQYFLIMIDIYSKWLEVLPMKNTATGNTLDKLRLAFASTGLPKEIVSDNGS